MAVTVEVSAEWRVSRAELSQPYSDDGVVYGYGEMLLTDAANADKAYGAMAVPMIHRRIIAVRGEAVDVNGTMINFDTVLTAMAMFFDKWRQEDQAAVDNPPAVRSLPPVPELAEQPPPPPVEAQIAPAKEPTE